MKRPSLPTVSLPVLPPSCGTHEPHGTAGYCPACAMARIDRERALHPEPRRDWPARRPNGALVGATLALATTMALALAALIFLMAGAASWHH